ncbi:hypothetical protein [Umezawaea sp.]|uniref:hypothetical protein n=1 Tax=Umezawaea sp. TaxID=1955258 RepID=UPI002ED14C90
MHLATYVGLLDTAERSLADAFRLVATNDAVEPDVARTCESLAAASDRHVERLAPVVARYGHRDGVDARPPGLATTHHGGPGLLRDLLDVYVLASFVDLTWTIVAHAARGLRDSALLDVAESCEQDTDRQLVWLRARVKHSAPRVLIPAR